MWYRKIDLSVKATVQNSFVTYSDMGLPINTSKKMGIIYTYKSRNVKMRESVIESNTFYFALKVCVRVYFSHSLLDGKNPSIR